MDIDRDCLWVLDMLHSGFIGGDLLMMDNDHLLSQWACAYAPETSHCVEKSIRTLLKKHLICFAATRADQSWVTTDVTSFPQEGSYLKDATYGLTKHGAQEWERWSMPDWGLYLEDTWLQSEGTCYDAGVAGTAEFRVASQIRLEDVFDRGPLYWGRRFDRSDPGCAVEIQKPFIAFYWKVLPAGIVCRVPYRQDAIPSRHRSEQSFRIWRRRGFSPAECAESLR